MATLVSAVVTKARLRLQESSASFWTDDELTQICIDGIKDLWRSAVDLKQEHFLTVDNTNVSLAANTATITGVPSDVHKVYLIEPRDLTTTSANVGLVFKPLDYNHEFFQRARARDDIAPQNDVIYYAITGAGGPVGAATIYVAPQVSSAVNLSFVYVPTLAAMTSASTVPIPGEADNALVAWTVAYARGKEREDRSPDPNWLTVYSTEKQNILQGLGVRQLQEPQFVDAVFEDYWG